MSGIAGANSAYNSPPDPRPDGQPVDLYAEAGAIGLYAKAIAGAVLLALTTWVSGLVDNNGMSDQEIVAVVSAFVVGGGGIFLIPMSPPWVNTYGKAVWTAIAAALASLWASVPNGMSDVEWLTLAIAVLVSAGVVAVVPNARRSDVLRPNTLTMNAPPEV